jgi:hypothetical protein
MNKRNYYIKQQRLKIAYERMYAPQIYKALREQKQIVLRQVRTHGPLTALIYIDQIPTAPLEDVLRRLYKRVGQNSAEAEYQRLQAIPQQKAGFGYSIDWLADIADFLDDYLLNKVVLPMTALTMERMRQTLTNDIALGKSYDEMVRDLADTELDKIRARLIARTEVNRATNFASNLAAKSYGYVTKKEWLSARDNRVRGNPKDGQKDKADHWDMNGQIVDDDQPFIDPRNGAQLMYPGDSSLGAPAASVCNCRCQILNIAQRDAAGNLIKK